MRVGVEMVVSVSIVIAVVVESMLVVVVWLCLCFMCCCGYLCVSLEVDRVFHRAMSGVPTLCTALLLVVRKEPGPSSTSAPKTSAFPGSYHQMLSLLSRPK